jgi:hypothetical protein
MYVFHQALVRDSLVAFANCQTEGPARHCAHGCHTDAKGAAEREAEGQGIPQARTREFAVEAACVFCRQQDVELVVFVSHVD